MKVKMKPVKKMISPEEISQTYLIVVFRHYVKYDLFDRILEMFLSIKIRHIPNIICNETVEGKNV